MTATMFEELVITLAEVGSTARYSASIPPHFEAAPWLDYQKATALALCGALSGELRALHDRPTAKRVHDTRVALRRWFSVWAVLKEDGWESRKFRVRVVRKLRKLLRLLGKLRDWDVNLELGAALGCPQSILDDWAKQQKLVRRAVKAGVVSLDTDVIISRIKKYLKNRPGKLEKKLLKSPDRPLSTYQKLDSAVYEQEKLVRELEAEAASPEELHQLRLAIKRWRYLMTEFFGLTNLELVRAQQLLGKLNDYQRLDSLLKDRSAPEASARLKSEKESLLQEFGAIRHCLPYGLRPLVLSISPEGESEAVQPGLLK